MFLWFLIHAWRNVLLLLILILGFVKLYNQHRVASFLTSDSQRWVQVREPVMRRFSSVSQGTAKIILTRLFCIVLDTSAEPCFRLLACRWVMSLTDIQCFRSSWASSLLCRSVSWRGETKISMFVEFDCQSPVLHFAVV